MTEIKAKKIMVENPLGQLIEVNWVGIDFSSGESIYYEVDDLEPEYNFQLNICPNCFQRSVSTPNLRIGSIIKIVNVPYCEMGYCKQIKRIPGDEKNEQQNINSGRVSKLDD